MISNQTIRPWVWVASSAATGARLAVVTRPTVSVDVNAAGRLRVKHFFKQVRWLSTDADDGLVTAREVKLAHYKWRFAKVLARC
jgi:hypothetical protein